MADKVGPALIIGLCGIAAAGVGGVLALKAADVDEESDGKVVATATIETASTVVHAAPLDLSGTVEGLDGRALWIVVFPDEGEGYYLTSDGPVAVTDGEWAFTDPQVGDETDIGSSVTYLAFAANEACSTYLSETPDDGEGNVFRAVMADSCGESIASRKVAVT